MKIHETDENAVILPGAKVVGDISFGPDCSVWYNAVMRADGSPIELGRGVNVQDNAVLHAGERPIRVGDYVTIGHGAIVHGCTLGSNVLVGMGAVILNDAVIGDNCIIAAGSVVAERSQIPAGSMVMGVPGKVRRPLREDEIEGIRKDSLHYVELKELHR